MKETTSTFDPAIIVKILLPLAGAGIMLGVGAFELPDWLEKMAQQWGPGFAMVLGVFAGIAYYVPRGVIPQFVDAQTSQAVALHDISRSMQEMGGQNSKVDEKLNRILQQHEEMMLDLRVGAERFRRLEETLVHEQRSH